jgi:hypothetical protein
MASRDNKKGVVRSENGEVLSLEASCFCAFNKKITNLTSKATNRGGDVCIVHTILYVLHIIYKLNGSIYLGR